MPSGVARTLPLATSDGNRAADVRDVSNGSIATESSRQPVRPLPLRHRMRKCRALVATPGANPKDPICFSPYLYRARNLIERYFNKIK